MAVTKHNVTYITFNTCAHLLTAYENIALLVNRKRVRYKPTGQESELNISSEHIANNLALINLNAAILEGTIRQLFSSLLKADSCIIGELSRNSTENQVILFKAYENIRQLNYNLELKGGWKNLKDNVRSYTNLNLDDLMTDKDIFFTLFTLRNSTAHGTALVTPKEIMAEADKDFYPYIWQNKLNSVQVFINKIFGTDLFTALNNPDFAKYFMDETIQFMLKVKETEIFKDNAFLLDNFEKFTFGKISSFQFLYKPEDIPSE